MKTAPRCWNTRGPASHREADMNERTCTVDGCIRPVHAKSMCGTHYSKNRSQSMPSCTVPGCPNRQASSGLCVTHRSRVRVHGTPRPDLPVIATVRYAPTCAFPGCGKPHQSLGYCSDARHAAPQARRPKLRWVPWREGQRQLPVEGRRQLQRHPSQDDPSQREGVRLHLPLREAGHRVGLRPQRPIRDHRHQDRADLLRLM